MAHMSSTDEKTFNEAQRKILLEIARAAIKHGLEQNEPLHIDPAAYDPVLQEKSAAFVTLHLDHQLRGCIGHLEAIQPLILDVAENAYSAAFRDPRFPPLTGREFPDLEIHLSILSPPEPITFTSEEELLEQIRPNIDGLILEEGYRRGTFLPSVWESLPDKRDFLSHLKMKAGMSPNYWSDDIKVSRYTSESFA